MEMIKPCNVCLNHYETGYKNEEGETIIEELHCKLNLPKGDLNCSKFKKYFPYDGMKEDTLEWYERFIEKPIQPLVKLLRDNGFETFSSCGHEMNCYCHYLMDGEIKRLYDLLINNGFLHFFIEVKIGGKDFSSIIVKIPTEEDKCKLNI